jgi:hypothetical protein
LFPVPFAHDLWKRKSSGLCGFISVGLLGMPIPIELEIEGKEKLPYHSIQRSLVYIRPFELKLSFIDIKAKMILVTTRLPQRLPDLRR